MKSFFIVLLFSCYLGFSQTLLKPDRVFDGTEMHENWVVLVEENLITYAGKLSDMDQPFIHEIDSGKVLYEKAG